MHPEPVEGRPRPHLGPDSADQRPYPHRKRFGHRVTVELHDNDTAPRHALLRLRVPRTLLRRMSFAQASALSITITSCAIVAAAAAVTYTDPDQFPHLGVGLWWAAATVTTVGYGDVVPSSPGGRLIGGVVMFLGIASLALLTAIAASAIVVGEVRSEEREIEKEETEILSELRKLTSRISRLEGITNEHIKSEGRTALGRRRDDGAQDGHLARPGLVGKSDRAAPC